MKPAGPPGPISSTPHEWSRFKFPDTAISWSAWMAVFVFIVWGIEYLDIPLDRLFGMLSGVLAFRFFCAGFAGKLLAEEIEAIDMGPVEAMKASGANLFQVVIWGAYPQIRVAFTGIAIYTWDVAFRAATVVGFFGAGGMGWYLKRNVLQIETERVAAILLSIIALVIVSEIASAWARARVMKMK